MRKRWLVLGVVVMVIIGGVFLALRLVQGNCQDWYHRVAFIAREMTEEGGPIVPAQARTTAIKQVGAKPFYCN